MEHTTQIEQRSSLRRAVNGISCCALGIATALLVGCGASTSGGGSLSGGNIATNGGSLSGGDSLTGGTILIAPPQIPNAPPQEPSAPPQDPIVVSVAQCSGGLATQDLAGQCRAVSPTPGALEAGNGTSAAGVSVVLRAVSQTASSSLQVSWQPFGNNASGYMVYFGNTADTANVLVSDLPTTSGLFDPNAPTVTYDAVRDLGLYAGDTVCFRIYAYDLARVLVDQAFLGCSAV